MAHEKHHAAHAVITAEQHAVRCRRLLAPAVAQIIARDAELIGVTDPSLTGRVITRALTSEIPLPPFDNSQMDGYAVCAADLAQASHDTPIALPLGTTTAAGDAPVTHRPGTASPVMTGAPIPVGADAVVPVELGVPARFPSLARVGEAVPEGEIAFTSPVTAGTFVRATGSDLPAGATVLEAGHRITPSRIGALAAAGIASVPVRSRARVLVCSTGDEIVDANDTAALAPGRIHDANAPMLAATLREAGAEVRAIRSGDRPEALRTALAEHWDWPDIVITIGGISAGAYEVVRETLAPLGAEYGHVALQPGGPQGLGAITLAGVGGERNIPILCFPGNPVSTVLSAELFALPTLRELAGLPATRPRQERRLSHATESPVEKLQLRRGRIDADGRVTLGGPSSHLLSELAHADVIAEIPLGVSVLDENDPITVWSFHD